MISPSNSPLYLNHIQVLSRPAPIPGRVNEDAWLVLESALSPGYVIAAVIDGASARFTIPKLVAAVNRDAPGSTAAAFAASLVRTSLIRQLNSRPDLPLPAALLAANQELQQAMANIIGGFSPEYILELAGIPAGEKDPRRMRLALPACVVTLARLDVTRRQLEYAHAGDTALLEIRRDGSVVGHTSDQMGRYDGAVLKYAERLHQEQGLAHLSEAIGRPEVRRLDIENGLRHNYVDEAGRTHPGEGCGVLNGLPELADYIERGTIRVEPDHTAGFCLLSDGLQLLAPLDETTAHFEARRREMGALLRTQGVRGLFEAVRQMAEADPYYEVYPRMKAQDDASGIYLEISETG
ncbi:MAG: protein phosphatase 2C domain-containing protein [Chloroflexota bacterium]